MKKLHVFLQFSPEDELFIGELAEKNNHIYFQYDSDFLKTLPI